MTDGDAELLPATRRALDHRLAVTQAEGRAPSVVAAVVREGRTVWTGGRGELPPGADPATVQYRIGSITKSLTAVQVLRLREEGLLDLGDPVGAHLSTPHGGGATVAQLLAHTGGLAAEARGPWWERTDGELRPELADVFGDRPQKHPQGRRFHYSNPGYALLGALIEKLRGAPWAEVLREEVLAPLGMTRTGARPEAPYAAGWAVHPYADVRQPEPAVDLGRLAAAGQLWSTAGDLARFAAFLLAGDPRVLGAAGVAELRAPAAAPEPADWDTGYGLGLQVARREGRLLAGHGGSLPGYVASVWAAPEERLGAVALANATSGVATSALTAGLLDLVARHEPAPPEPWRPARDADPGLVALTGVWHWGTAPVVLRLHAGGVLSLGPAAGGGRRSRFDPAGDGAWTGREGYYAGETLRVVRRQDGTADHLDVGSFVLTREPYEPGSAVPGGTDPGGWR
ncbi:serine hydrolase domain-containing protein [Streptomyces sp. MP131-18]|uniref:serine hydrolase domain-containing protein n=1 Tax=Streptomyces sp. MP131-18 TaxID=1857892 RepID=UPI0009CBA768|nr:serine hydrolase domain-containing protein [Streptomyces sp. MP131-18]ONK12836.1 FmtA-like protein [Streptomyces sp. MP131-18]